MATYPRQHTNAQTDTDPFSGGIKIPSLSWKGLPIGTVFTCEVLEPAKLLQSRNFESGEPDYWDEAKTQPVMSAVVNVLVTSGPHSVGEQRSIWAQKPSNLFVAIAEAQKTAGALLAPGGTLALRFDGEVPHTNPRYSPIKQYKAKYTIPVTSGEDDAFGETPPAPPTQQPRPAFMGPRPAAAPAVPSAKKGW